MQRILHIMLDPFTVSLSLQFNIAAPDTGCQKKLEVDDENKLCVSADVPGSTTCCRSQFQHVCAPEAASSEFMQCRRHFYDKRVASEVDGECLGEVRLCPSPRYSIVHIDVHGLCWDAYCKDPSLCSTELATATFSVYRTRLSVLSNTDRRSSVCRNSRATSSRSWAGVISRGSQ